MYFFVFISFNSSTNKWCSILVLFNFQDVVANNMEDDDIVKETLNDWWMSHTSYLQLLAVLVHRGNPDIACDLNVVSNIDTRKTIREEDAVEIKHPSLAKEAEATTTNRAKKDEQMMSAKMALMEQAFVSRVIKQEKEQLNLSKEFKSSIDNVPTQGNAASNYDKAAHDLLMQLPCVKKCRGDNNSNT